VPTAYVLLNSDLGSDETIISKVKEILDKEENIKYEVQGVYGVYDIVLKISSDNSEKLRGVITNKIRKIDKVQSTLTMMVIEEQENL
jgi:DNA-binding Lrp family transcriptional regulator